MTVDSTVEAPVQPDENETFENESNATLTTVGFNAFSDHPLYVPLVKPLADVLSQAVSDLERTKVTANESEEDGLSRMFRNSNEDEVPGIDAVRARIREILAQEKADSGDMSDDERKAIRSGARALYNETIITFENLVKAGVFALPEGFEMPKAPGGGGGATGHRGTRDFTTVRGLKHRATIGDTEVSDVTFAVLSQKSKTPTGTIVKTLESHLGYSLKDLPDMVDNVSWSFQTEGGDNVEVISYRKA